MSRISTILARLEIRSPRETKQNEWMIVLLALLALQTTADQKCFDLSKGTGLSSVFLRFCAKCWRCCSDFVDHKNRNNDMQWTHARMAEAKSPTKKARNSDQKLSLETLTARFNFNKWSNYRQNRNWCLSGTWFTISVSLSSFCIKVFNQKKVETIEPRFLSYRAPYKEISLPNNLLRYIPAESVTRHIIRLDLRFNQIATFYPEDIARGRQILFIRLYLAV